MITLINNISNDSRISERVCYYNTVSTVCNIFCSAFDLIHEETVFFKMTDYHPNRVLLLNKKTTFVVQFCEEVRFFDDNIKCFNIIRLAQPNTTTKWSEKYPEFFV